VLWVGYYNFRHLSVRQGETRRFYSRRYRTSESRIIWPRFRPSRLHNLHHQTGPRTHFLAHFPYILANKLRNLTKKRDGKRYRLDLRLALSGHRFGARSTTKERNVRSWVKDCVTLQKKCFRYERGRKPKCFCSMLSITRILKRKIC
jgi:hypothetical protein